MSMSLINFLCNHRTWLLFCSFLGLLYLIRFTIFFLHSSYVFLLRPAKDLKSYGAWALVTGSTDGIGKAVAHELARKNLNLVLAGRDQNKLDAVSAEIQEKNKGVEIKKVVIDLSGDLREGMELLREAIEGLDIGVLVNNAGAANKRPSFLHRGQMETWVEMMKVNSEATTMVTRVVLRGMLERSRGAILNIGSGSTVAVPSLPLFAVYSATKAYVDQFSKCLYAEYKSRGIAVQCQIPLFVDTKMLPEIVRVRWRCLLAPSEEYARAAVRSIGYGPQCVPYLPHFIQCHLIRLVPELILNRVFFAKGRKITLFGF